MPPDSRASLVAIAAAGTPNFCANESPLMPASSLPGPPSCAIQALTPWRMHIAAVGAPAKDAPTATTFSHGSCSK